MTCLAKTEDEAKGWRRYQVQLGLAIHVGTIGGINSRTGAIDSAKAQAWA